MVLAFFRPNSVHPDDYPVLWQYDYGQILRIQGLNLPSAVEIHFSLQERGSDSVTRIGITKDGVTDVIIPDSMLENRNLPRDYNIYAFVYITDDTSGQTEYKITLSVKSRPKPEAFEKPEDAELFREAIKAVNDAAQRAEVSEDNAKSYAEQATQHATQTGKDCEAVQEMVNMVFDIDKQVEAVKEYSQSAERAALGADSAANYAEQFKIAAERAGTEANDASITAKEVATKVAEDRVAVASVKEDVDKVVHDFSDVVQQALDGVNTAGKTQTERVQEEGNKQFNAVEQKGKEVLESIPKDFQTQMERKLDKQQGIENAGKALVIGKDGLVVPVKPQEDGANAIVNVATDELIVVNDSAERKIQGLRMMGKTEQASTTGAQLLNLKDGSYTVAGVTVEIINGTVKLSGTATSNGGRTIKLSEPFLLKPGTYISETDIPADCILSKASDNSYMTSANQSFIVKEDIEVYFGINFTSQKSYNGAYHVMLNSGNVSLPYEPYTGGKPSPSPEYPQKLVSAGKLNEGTGKYEVDVNLTGKNLFDIEKAKDTRNWIDIQHIAKAYVAFPIYIGKIGANITASYSERLNTGLELYLNLSPDLVTCKWLYHGVQASNIKQSATITASDKYVYIRCNVNHVDTFIENIKTMQIEISDAQTPYEPYKGQFFTISTPNGLPGIPVKSGGNYTDSTGQQWICDEIDLGRGKYVERIWTKVFDGSEEWGIYGTLGLEGFSSYNVLPSVSERRAGLCNLYEVKTVNDEKEGIWLGVRNSKIYACKSRFYDDSLTDKGLANWKAFLAAHPMTVMTYVDTPTERDLTPEEIEAYKALRTYYPTTIIQNSEGVNMEVSYVADTKNYIDNKIAELSTALVNTQAQLL